MDLQGIPKRRWRAGIIEAYQERTGDDTLPFNHHFFTLGGPATEQNSELDYFCQQRRFCSSRQYVSVERQQHIHRANSRIKGPTWIHGDFGKQFQEWYYNLPLTHHVGVVNADLMCGMDKALDTIWTVIETLEEWREEGAPQCLLVVNVVQSMRWRENQGYKFPDAVSTFRNSYMRTYWKNVVDCYQYHNKTVGKGAGITTLQTLMLWV